MGLMSGAVVEEMITFDQTMKNSSGRRSYAKKKEKRKRKTSAASADNDIGFEECAFIN